MAQQASISIRVEKDLKKQFYSLCEDIGLSASTALSIFMKTVVRERKIPFEIGLTSSNARSERFKANFEAMRHHVAQSDTPDMSLDEINQLIKDVRDARK